jgi:hypothetical protein
LSEEKLMQAINFQPRWLLAWSLGIGFVLVYYASAFCQSPADTGEAADFGSINTPRPINPASGTTNPSARATQNLNPYLGSTP